MHNAEKKGLVGLDSAELDGERRVADRYVVGYLDVELVEPHEARRQTLIGDNSLCLSEEERGVGVQIRSLGGDITGSGRGSHRSKPDSVDREKVARLGRTRRYPSETLIRQLRHNVLLAVDQKRRLCLRQQRRGHVSGLHNIVRLLT